MPNVTFPPKGLNPDTKMLMGKITLGTSPARSAGRGYSVSYTATGEFDITLDDAFATVLMAVGVIEDDTANNAVIVRVKEIVSNVVTFVVCDTGTEAAAPADAALTSAELMHFMVAYQTNGMAVT